jgi:ATP-binding cassette subfamily F protein 3
MVKQAVGTMSGGEKARLVLAMIVWQRPNLLLLDEPTNHLDLATREALAMALNDFDGTVMLVSHDRALLRSVCEDFWMVGRGVVGPFDGDLDDYQRYLLEESKRLREEARLAEQAQAAGVNTTAAAPSPAVAASAPVAASASTPAAPLAPATRDGREQRKIDAQTRQQLAEKTRPLKKELEQIDKRLAALSAERASLEQKLTEPLPPAEIAECGRRLKVGNDETAQLEERWLEISSALEEISAATAT